MDPLDAADSQIVCPENCSQEVRDLVEAILVQLFAIAGGEQLYIRGAGSPRSVIVPCFRANAATERNLITFFPTSRALKVDIRPSAPPNRTGVTAENLGEIADRLRERWALLQAAD